MAWTPPRSWSPGETVTASLMNTHLRDDLNALAVTDQYIPRGGVIYNPTGIVEASANILSWRVPYACTAVRIRGRRVGGGASLTQINARKNFTDELLATDLDLTAAATDYESTTLQNETFSPGDWLEVMATAIAGSPTQIYIVVEFDSL